VLLARDFGAVLARGRERRAQSVQVGWHEALVARVEVRIGEVYFECGQGEFE